MIFLLFTELLRWTPILFYSSQDREQNTDVLYLLGSGYPAFIGGYYHHKNNSHFQHDHDLILDINRDMLLVRTSESTTMVKVSPPMLVSPL